MTKEVRPFVRTRTFWVCAACRQETCYQKLLMCEDARIAPTEAIQINVVPKQRKQRAKGTTYKQGFLDGYDAGRVAATQEVADIIEHQDVVPE